MEMNNTEQSQSNNKTIIGRDAQFKGDMSFENNLQILGSFEGKLTTTGNLVISSEAIVKADIEANTVVIEGSIQGNLLVKDIVELSKTAIIKGDIECGRLTMSAGASFEGNFKIGKMDII